jgi:hypothetical protein
MHCGHLHERWVGHFSGYKSSGCYGRSSGPNRDVRYAQDHIVKSKRVLPLAGMTGEEVTRGSNVGPVNT